MTEQAITRPVAVADVPAEGLEIDLVATEEERRALAGGNDVLSVESLEARFELKAWGRDGLSVSGRLDARAERTCVVTLEPFVETVSEPIELRFSPTASPDADPLDPGAAEPLVNGTVDLGAIAAEFFTLGLAPHPRKPGASFRQDEDRAGTESPFAVLAARRDLLKGR